MNGKLFCSGCLQQLADIRMAFGATRSAEDFDASLQGTVTLEWNDIESASAQHRRAACPALWEHTSLEVEQVDAVMFMAPAALAATHQPDQTTSGTG